MSDLSNLGPKGEELAAEYLADQGYVILEMNYKNNIGEIDIIAKDGSDYCFIEVKTRTDDSAGEPLEAVTANKQYRLHKIALGYIQEKDLFDEYSRFDVVGVSFSGEKPHIELVQNAFEVTSL